MLSEQSISGEILPTIGYTRWRRRGKSLADIAQTGQILFPYLLQASGHTVAERRRRLEPSRLEDDLEQTGF